LLKTPDLRQIVPLTLSLRRFVHGFLALKGKHIQMRNLNLSTFLFVGFFPALFTQFSPSECMAGDLVITHGYDLLRTQSAFFGDFEFKGVPIGKFDFGSSIGKHNVEYTDTIIQRIGPSIDLTTHSSGTFDIAVVALHLESVHGYDNMGNIDDVNGLHIFATTDGSGTGSITINELDPTTQTGTWSNVFDLPIFFHLGGFNQPAITDPNSPLAPITVHGVLGSGHWTPTPALPPLNPPVIISGVNDDHFYLSGPGHHVLPGHGLHTVHYTACPEPNSCVLLSTGGVIAGLSFGRSRRRKELETSLDRIV
jgi:hypothetical protein